MRDWHGRFARGTVKKTPRMVPMAEIYEEAGEYEEIDGCDSWRCELNAWLPDPSFVMPAFAAVRKLTDAPKRGVAARWCVLRDAPPVQAWGRLCCALLSMR